MLSAILTSAEAVPPHGPVSESADAGPPAFSTVIRKTFRRSGGALSAAIDALRGNGYNESMRIIGGRPAVGMAGRGKGGR